MSAILLQKAGQVYCGSGSLEVEEATRWKDKIRASSIVMCNQDVIGCINGHYDWPE